MEKKTYTHFEYAPYNDAVNTDLLKQREVLELTRARKRNLVLKNAFYITLILAVIVIVITFVWFIANGFPTSSNQVNSNDNVEQTKQIAKAKDAATQIIEQKPNTGITTKFNIFSTRFTVSGDKVITGMEFLPEDPSKPHWQYCYVEDTKGNRVNIATKKGIKKIKIKTKDEFLIKEALPLCNFEK
jgi:hypothetical protein